MPNKRKTYGETNAERGDECPRCGCRHFYTQRCSATAKTVSVVKTCRNCGKTVIVDAV